jgi:uncharacterized protein YbjT (DUF2867 family)
MATETQTAAQAVKVVVAGATGLVGKELVAELLSDTAVNQVTVLTRRAWDGPASEKLNALQVNFAQLGTLPCCDELYICLGTTISTAGSQAAFRAVDFDAVLATAQAAIAAAAGQPLRIGVVSAMGASATSNGFYNRVKGEMEAALSSLANSHKNLSLFIAQPSLLLGDRSQLAQKSRPGEKAGIVFAKLFNPLIPAAYKAIEPQQVARALRLGTRTVTGVQTATSDKLRAA